jgi:hypothetical protein
MKDLSKFWIQIFCILLTVLFISIARADCVLKYTFNGLKANDQLGTSVSRAGDVNRDGYEDIILGAPYNDSCGNNAGVVFVYSGKTGTLLYTLLGDSAGDELGRSVSWAGDVNNDGYDDFIAGAPYASSSRGKAKVFSGRTGALIYSFSGSLPGVPGDLFGFSVSGLGDIDGDGYADVIIGSPYSDTAGTDRGAAFVYSGRTGARLYTLWDGLGDRFGYAVSYGGDVNKDGVPDIIVGEPWGDSTGTDAGIVYVYSGATGNQLYHFKGEAAGDNFGLSVASAGDVNGDGYDDLLIGASGYDVNNGGSVYLYSGKTGALLGAIYNPGLAGDNFGCSVSGAGDLNGDGKDDFIVGARYNDAGGSNAGRVYLFSGATGFPLLCTLTGEAIGDYFGWSVAGGGDVDRNGIPDIVVGAPNNDAGGSNAGRAYVYRPKIETTLELNSYTNGPLAPARLPDADSNDQIGIVFHNDSPEDTVILDSVSITLYNDPGIVRDTTYDLKVRIYRTDNDSMFVQGSPLAEIIVPNSSFVGKWHTDSVITVTARIWTDSASFPPGAYGVVQYQTTSTNDTISYMEGLDQCGNGLPQISSFTSSKQSDISSMIRDLLGQFSSNKIEDVRLMKPKILQGRLWEEGVHRITKKDALQSVEFFNSSPPHSYTLDGFFSNPIPTENQIKISLKPELSYLVDEIKIAIDKNVVSTYTKNVSFPDNVLTFNDDQMYLQPQGLHQYSVIFGNDQGEEEVYRTCFHTIDRPLVLRAPWAKVTDKSFTTSDGIYTIDAIVPPINLEFQADIPLVVTKLHNEVDLNWNIHQLAEFSDGSNNAQIDDRLKVIILNHKYLDEALGVFVDEDFGCWGSGPDYVCDEYFYLGLPPHVWPLGCKTLFSGNLFTAQVWALPPIDLKVDGELWICGDIAIEGVLTTPRHPESYGSITFAPGVCPHAKLTGSAELLFGLADAKAEIGADIKMRLPIKIGVDQYGQGNVDADFCIRFYMPWRVWASICWGWKKWDIAKGTWTVMDQWDGLCAGLPEPACETTKTNTSVVLDSTLQWDTTYSAEPSIIASNDGKKMMAVFAHPEGPQKAEIWYSIFTDSLWSPPVSATNTSNAKSDVRITAFGPSSFAMIWTENHGLFPGSPPPDSIIPNNFLTQDIFVSIFDTVAHAWATPARLTDDNRADGRPVIAAYGNKLYAAWVRHDNDYPFALNNLKIFYSFYNGSSWSSPQALSSEVGYNLQPDIAIDTKIGKAGVVWVLDRDANIYSPSDRSLKFAYIDGNGIASSPVTVNTKIGPFSPSLGFAPNGKAVVAYESMGYRYDSLGVIYDSVGLGVNSQIVSSVREDSLWMVKSIVPDDSIFGAKPVVVIDPNNIAHLAIRGFEHDSGRASTGNIFFTRLNLNGTSQAWMGLDTLTHDTTTTDLGDLAVDRTGNARILYMNLESAPTSLWPHGMDRVYEVTKRICGVIGGDVNCDAKTTVSDVVYQINYLFKGGPAPYPYLSGDVNCDGKLTVGDVVYLVNYLFKGGPQPCK